MEAPMCMEHIQSIPKPTLQRMPAYCTYLNGILNEGIRHASSATIAKALGLTPIQVRKDLAYISDKGRPRTGYAVDELISDIETFLGYQNTKDAFIVGAGRLGQTLLAYEGFRTHGLNLVAAFDSDKKKEGLSIAKKPVYHIDKMVNLVGRMEIRIGILTTPDVHAQTSCDRMVEAGVLAIWNFTNVHLIVPDNVIVQNENLAASLVLLSSKLTNYFNQKQTEVPNMKKSISEKFERVCAIVDKYNRDPSKLIAILQDIQEEYNYLPEEIMTFVSTALGISPSKVYGVATFYSHFTLEPKGKYVIKICDGTACHVKKSTAILTALQKELGLSKDTITTPDRMFTLEVVACLGACGLAPVVVINEKVHGLVTPEKVITLINDIKKDEVSEHGTL